MPALNTVDAVVGGTVVGRTAVGVFVGGTAVGGTAVGVFVGRTAVGIFVGVVVKVGRTVGVPSDDGNALATTSLKLAPRVLLSM